MNLLPLFQSIQGSVVGTSIRESVWLFPVIEAVHVLALAVSVGLILLTDLRLIGVWFVNARASDIMRQLRPWMIGGFGAMFASGGLLFWSEAANCYKSPTFRIKLAFLAAAGLNALWFETTSGRAAATWDGMTLPPPRVRLVGWISLVCWAAVIVFGRWTAYGLN